ncbi:MAG: hypothetical protein WB812_07460 [Woeseiaceae bacterium]
MHLRNFPAGMAVLLCLSPLPATAIAAVASQKDAAEIASYRLSMDVAHKVEAAALAMQRGFEAAGEDEPDLFDEDEDLDDSVASLEGNPITSAALRSAGISAREFMSFLTCWAQTALYAQFAQSGKAENMPLKVLPENLQFVADHAEELDAMRREWKEDED